MKVFEDLFSKMHDSIKGIAVVNKEGEIVFKEGEGELFAEGVGILGSAGEASLKNIGLENFFYIKGYLQDGAEIFIIEHEDMYVGVKGEEVNIDEIKEFIASYKETEVREKVPVAETSGESQEVSEEITEETEVKKEEVKTASPSTPVEKFVFTKMLQINELINEFAPGDELRWGKVVYAKIKDTSPELAEFIKQDQKSLRVTYPLSENITEETVNKSFRAAIDIIWKMGVSKYGAEEARRKVKKVAERLKVI